MGSHLDFNPRRVAGIFPDFICPPNLVRFMGTDMRGDSSSRAICDYVVVFRGSMIRCFVQATPTATTGRRGRLDSREGRLVVTDPAPFLHDECVSFVFGAA